MTNFDGGDYGMGVIWDDKNCELFLLELKTHL
jgi:hypothetical protein